MYPQSTSIRCTTHMCALCISVYMSFMEHHNGKKTTNVQKRDDAHRKQNYMWMCGRWKKHTQHTAHKKSKKTNCVIQLFMSRTAQCTLQTAHKHIHIVIICVIIKICVFCIFYLFLFLCKVRSYERRHSYSSCFFLIE